MKTAERQITKDEFKQLYFEYLRLNPCSGWTKDYWNHFYENETGMKYVVTEPESLEADIMWIGGEKLDEHRMFFLSEADTESHFDFPGKE